MATILDYEEWVVEAKRKGFIVIKDPCHKGNASAYLGNRVVGYWSVNRGEGKLLG